MLKWRKHLSASLADSYRNLSTGMRFGTLPLVGADGTVHPIFAGTAWGQSITLASSNQAGTSNVLGFVDKELCWTCAALTTNFYHDDQIGSSRMLTAGGGWPVWQGTFLPYGEEYNNPLITPNHYKFTGKERDNETGLDYFGARYYANTLSRFLTPDWAAKPEAVPYSDLHDPQSLNLYSYVRNIPTVRVDADGHDTNGLAHGVEDFDRRMDPIYRWVAKALQHPAVQAFLELFAIKAGGEMGAAFGSAAKAGLRAAPAAAARGAAVAGSEQAVAASARQAISTLGMREVTGTIEGFSVGRLANGAEIAARIQTSGGNTTVGILGAYNAGGAQFAGTLNALEKGAMAVAEKAGSSTVTIQAIATNTKLTNFLLKQGFTKTTVQVGKEIVPALQKTMKVVKDVN